MYIYVLYIYCGWVRNPAIPKGWFFIQTTATLTIYQLVQDFATIHQLRQAGKDVKENLKNWAKQQEAELAEDGHGDNYALRKIVINMDQILLDDWYPL